VKRFSLRFLFAATTVLIVFLGYGQWRRQRIIDMCRFLRERGVTISVPSDWRDYVWQRTPGKAIVRNRLPLGLSGLDDTSSDGEVAQTLKKLGVSDIRYVVEIENIMPPDLPTRVDYSLIAP
jgi:hypothetical protein